MVVASRVGRVFDRVHAGFQRGQDPIRSVRVRGHLAAEEVRRLDDRLHLVVEQLLAETAGDVAVHAAGRGELDDVGALRDLLAGGATAVVGAVAQVGRARPPQLGDVPIRVVGGIRVPAGARDPRTRRHDRRPRDQTGGDGVAQRGDAVGIGAQVAHGGEAGFERTAHVVHADQQVVLDVAVVRLEARAHLVVVVEDVHVRIDEAGQHELLPEIDQPGAGRRRDVAVTNRFDAAAAHDDGGRTARRLARTIEQRAGVDDDDGFGWRLRQVGRQRRMRASRPAQRSRRAKFMDKSLAHRRARFWLK